MKKNDPNSEMTKCQYFDTCSAPICPLHQDSIEYGVWFPDEEICKRREFCKKNWIQNQKKILSKHNKKSVPGYFTVKMLDRKLVIKGGIVGIDSDKIHKTEEVKWIEAHPELKISKEKREQARKIANEIWAKRNKGSH